MKMLMNSSGMEMNMNMNSGCSFEVVNSTADEKDIKVTYTQMKMTTDMGALKSHNPDSAINKNYENIIGKSVMLKLSKDNEIMDVTGFDEIVNSQARDSASKEMMKKMFSKEQLNNTFGMLFSIYPKHPVKVGESWNNESNIKMANIDMKIANKYTLLSVKDGYAEINIDGTIGAAGNMMKNASGLKMDMSGTQKGTVNLRMDNGYLHNGAYKMDMTANMEMMGKKMTMTMKSNYLTKGD